VAADALVARIAENDSALVLGDSEGNTWRIVPDGANAVLNVTRNGSIVGFNGLRKIAEKTVDYAVLESDCGTYFIANHGSTDVNFTLPAPATTTSGVWYTFTNVGAAGMTITSGTADTLVVGNDAAADSIAYVTSNEMIGWSCEVFTDGALWYVRNNVALEAHTATVVTAD
jgi:hypothetical protein